MIGTNWLHLKIFLFKVFPEDSLTKGMIMWSFQLILTWRDLPTLANLSNRGIYTTCQVGHPLFLPCQSRHLPHHKYA